MVQGNDGGANVSFNGGRTWSGIYNQPTSQFYRMDVDNQYPYRVYATQQDNTSVSVPSQTEWGMITKSDLQLPGTGESGFIAVHPDDPDIVFVGAVGSSPGGNGALQRYDKRTRQVQLVNVWPEEATAAPRKRGRRGRRKEGSRERNREDPRFVTAERGKWHRRVQRAHLMFT